MRRKHANPSNKVVRHALDASSFILSVSGLRCGAKNRAHAAENSGPEILLCDFGFAG
jgi:hypothetical protein